MEIFVVEFLIFIYGEKILEPYFQNNVKKFFYQFDNFSIFITAIEQFLSIIANNRKCQIRRLSYLCLTDRIPNVLKDDEEFLTKLTLDAKSLRTISQHIDANKEIILKNIEQYGDIDVAKHQFKNQQKEAICDKFYLEYQKEQRWCFERILRGLIKMAEAKGISLDDIKSFVAESLFYKNNDFKYLYTSSIESLLNFKVKKR